MSCMGMEVLSQMCQVHFLWYNCQKIKGQITVGIIGPEFLRESLKVYLRKLHSHILSEDSVRPNFPGIESAFGISINFESLVEIDVKESELEEYKKYVDSH